jgi:hypothetical protein
VFCVLRVCACARVRAHAGAPEAAYRSALLAELRKAGGAMSLSALGSKVRRRRS